MTLLGNINNLIEDEQEGYTLPAVIRDDEKQGMSFKKALAVSTVMHPLTVGLICLLLFVLTLMGISLTMFERPKPKASDIEFVLVDKEATPVNKNTKYRSDKNSRTGGKNDPKRKVSMPSPSPTKSSKPAPQVNDTQKLIKKMQKQIQTQQKAAPRKQVQQAPSKAPSQARPQPPSARPSVRPPSAPPRVVAQSSSPFAIPVPKDLPSGKSYSTGPIGGSGSAKSSGGGSYAPTPSLSPTVGGSGAGSSAGSKMSRGGGGSGNAGNPGGGGGAPGIDAIREPDFGPYMRELQRRIKMNWDPPKGNESKRVVLLFKIARDGRLLSTRVFKSSGLPSSDKAAISAVELTAPFKPLPPDFKGASIDIQFTFDYNVFGATGY